MFRTLICAGIAFLTSSCSVRYCGLACDNTHVNLPAIDHTPGSYRLHGMIGEFPIECDYTATANDEQPDLERCKHTVTIDPASGPRLLRVVSLHESVSLELTRDGVRVYKLDLTNPKVTNTPSCNRNGCTKWTFDPPSA